MKFTVDCQKQPLPITIRRGGDIAPNADFQAKAGIKKLNFHRFYSVIILDDYRDDVLPFSMYFMETAENF